jgi:aminoglycoside phosphotransferase (APT) family kinase protein
MVKSFLEHLDDGVSDDPVAVKLVAFLKEQYDEILDLVRRAHRLAPALQARSPEYVLCHSDIHAGNILIDTSGVLYIVDWDDPILAPKERDLMFIGGGVCGVWNKALQETLFSGATVSWRSIQSRWRIIAANGSFRTLRFTANNYYYRRRVVMIGSNRCAI